jgi:hypothetical protein
VIAPCGEPMGCALRGSDQEPETSGAGSRDEPDQRGPAQLCQPMRPAQVAKSLVTIECP